MNTYGHVMPTMMREVADQMHRILAPPASLAANN